MAIGKAPHFQETGGEGGAWTSLKVGAVGSEKFEEQTKKIPPLSSSDWHIILITQKCFGINMHIRKWQQGTEKEAQEGKFICWNKLHN